MVDRICVDTEGGKVQQWLYEDYPCGTGHKTAIQQAVYSLWAGEVSIAIRYGPNQTHKSFF